MSERNAFGRRSVLKGLAGTSLLPLLGQPAAAATSSDSWTVVAIPDTQIYAESDSGAEYVHDQTKWIVNNLDTENIPFVSHEGDLVGGAWDLDQWDRIDAAMSRLDGVVPYSTPPGNHDWESWNDKSSSLVNYIEYFGPSRYEGRSWYGGSGPWDLCTYQYFDAGGHQFLHLALEWEAQGSPDDSSTPIGWANDLLTDHPNTPTIVTTHAHITDEPRNEGRTEVVEEVNGWGKSGEYVWQELISQHPQVFMMLNGHEHKDTGEQRLVSQNDAGYPVYQMLANYQHYDTGGDGFLRKIRFEPDGGADGLDRIAVETYSPTLDRYQTDDDSQFHFDVNFDRRFNAQRYEIRNVGTGKALDVESVSTDDGANVHQWEYGSGENQQWYLVERGAGYYSIQAAHSDKVIDVEGAATEDGANVQQWSYAGGENQQWALEPDSNGNYRIGARHSGKVLEVAGGSTDDGANVQQWSDGGADHQRWDLRAL